MLLVALVLFVVVFCVFSDVRVGSGIFDHRMWMAFHVGSC